jgi:quinoprotein glucose dehydrogenase
MRKRILVPAAMGAALLTAVLAAQSGWPNYGHDAGGERYSPLTQITPANVKQLGVAWTFNTGETDRSYEMTPLVVDGVMYATTPSEQVVALDGVTGKKIWEYDPHEARVRTNRGVSYWPGDAQHAPRIVLATSGDGRIIELDAKTGVPVASFGKEGSVVVVDGLVPPGQEARGYGFTSPPAIYKDLIILAPDLQEGPSHGLPGTVSAFNAISGKLAWRFYLTAQPGTPGGDSWGPGGTKDRSGPAAWAGITVDDQSGLVFVNTANPADSYYGGDRPGDNLYSVSLVALHVATGKLDWYYQTVHHDLTDTDMAGQPVLIPAAGPNHVPAVATISKQSLLFILNRKTGKPIFGAVEKPVVQSDVPGEHSSPTQPFPVLPPPLAIQSATPADVSTVTPESEAYCKQQFAGYKNFGPYTPFMLVPSVKFPSSVGGANYGGMSYDPALGYIFVNVSDLGNKGQMFASDKMPARRGGFGRSGARGGRGAVAGRAGAPAGERGGERGGGRAAPRETMPYRNPDVGQRFVDDNGYPCQQPPWGTLSAVNVHTGHIAWQVPLGDYPELTALGVKQTGTPNIGGTITTASGLVFVAATMDGDFRAFDANTGKQVWQTALDGYGVGTPTTYEGSDSKQYVAIATGGPGSLRGTHHEVGAAPNRIVVYALGATGTLPAPTPGAAEASPVAPAPAAASVSGAAGALPAGAGRVLVQQVCSQCHSLDTVTSVHQSQDAWTATVNDMVGRGAQLTNAQVAEVAKYLADHYAAAH